MRIPLAGCLLSCVLDVDLLYFFFSTFPFSISIWTSLVSSCFFLVGTGLSRLLGFGFCCDSFSIRCNICILIRTYTDLTFSFLSEVYDLFQLLCVLSFVFICFPPEIIFRSRVIGAGPVTTDCIVATV